MQVVRLHKTVGVKVGRLQVGGGAPVLVQSMTMTDTADARATAAQCVELAEAGSEMVRVTVNVPEAAAAVPEIKQRMLDAGCEAPLIGDFHYNGHLLLAKHPACAVALDKYRINPGNVGTGRRRDEQFATICRVAVDQGRPVRIGVNGGSLNQELVVAKMQENSDRDLGKTSEEIINECMVLSALQSTALAMLEFRLQKDALIATLLSRLEAMDARLAALEMENAALRRENAALRDKLNLPPKTPDNSSLPPSHGHKASSETSSKPKGRAHAGTHRPLHPSPTRKRDVMAARCGHCAADVSGVAQTALHSYDRIEIPEIVPDVTRVTPHEASAMAQLSEKIRGSTSTAMSAFSQSSARTSRSTNRTKSTGAIALGLPPPNAIRCTRPLPPRSAPVRSISDSSAAR